MERTDVRCYPRNVASDVSRILLPTLARVPLGRGYSCRPLNASTSGVGQTCRSADYRGLRPRTGRAISDARFHPSPAGDGRYPSPKPPTGVAHSQTGVRRTAGTPRAASPGHLPKEILPAPLRAEEREGRRDIAVIAGASLGRAESVRVEA